MSDIRREFYEAINKANVQKPKKAVKKSIIKESVSIKEQIQNIIGNCDSAIIDCRITINNQPLIDYLYEITKKDEKSLELERKINQELEIINKLRDEARKKYNRFNRMNEFSSFNPSAAAAASSAAGAGAGAGGGGSLRISVDPTTNSYVVDSYVEDYLV
jgi:hypothetical protein